MCTWAHHNEESASQMPALHCRQVHPPARPGQLHAVRIWLVPAPSRTISVHWMRIGALPSQSWCSCMRELRLPLRCRSVPFWMRNVERRQMSCLQRRAVQRHRRASRMQRVCAGALSEYSRAFRLQGMRYGTVPRHNWRDRVQSVRVPLPFGKSAHGVQRLKRWTVHAMCRRTEQG